MKTKRLVVAVLSLTSVCWFAWGQSAGAAKKQFMLIVRSKVKPSASPEMISTNIKHWGEYMGSLGQSGQLAGGYRPGTDGETISGMTKTGKMGIYSANGEVVSSVLIINADDSAKAREIASRCPVFELEGSVEIRPLQNNVH